MLDLASDDEMEEAFVATVTMVATSLAMLLAGLTAIAGTSYAAWIVLKSHILRPKNSFRGFFP